MKKRVLLIVLLLSFIIFGGYLFTSDQNILQLLSEKYKQEEYINLYESQGLLPSQVSPSHLSSHLTQEELEKLEIEEFGKTLPEIEANMLVLYEEKLNSQGYIKFKWTADYENYLTTNSTHRLITWKAKDMLKADGKENWFKTAHKYRMDLYKGCDDADLDGLLKIFYDHFHEPETKTSYKIPLLNNLSYFDTSITAADNCQKEFDTAVDHWEKGEKSLAFYYLGKALHYLQDSNEPHHAALYPAPFTSHDEFEEFANQEKYSYQYQNGGLYNWARNPYQYCHQSAVYAKPLIKYVDNKNERTHWHFTADLTLKKAQEVSAGLIGEFLQTVGLPEN